MLPELKRGNGMATPATAYHEPAEAVVLSPVGLCFFLKYLPAPGLQFLQAALHLPN